MPLHAIPPGKRKGNKTWLFRGRIGGKVVEASSALTAAATARQVREAQAEAEREAWRQHEARRIPRPGENTTFGVAAIQYLNWRDPEGKLKLNRQRLEKLLPYLGDRPLADISAPDITDLANRLYPHATLSSRNSLAIIPAAAVIHFAAKNRWCADLKIPHFKVPRPKTRDVSDEVAEALIRATPEGGYQRLFMLWIFRQGDRVSDPLNVRWEQINLSRQTVTSWIEKADEERTRPLHDEVFEALAAMPAKEREGYLFPWRNRWQVYVWLYRITKKLGVNFTAHMARHTVGRQLNAAGVPLKTAMEVLGHKDPRSTLRYQGVDEPAVRAALGQLGGKRGEVVGSKIKYVKKSIG